MKLKNELDKLQNQSYATGVQGSNPTTNPEIGNNYFSINQVPPASEDALRNAASSVINEENEKQKRR